MTSNSNARMRRGRSTDTTLPAGIKTAPAMTESPLSRAARVRLIAACVLPMTMLVTGCASHRYGHILDGQDKDLVGSHAAGAATWNTLVDDSVARLLGSCPPPTSTAAFSAVSELSDDPATVRQVSQRLGDTPLDPQAPLASGVANVCFLGVENVSAEDLGDFKDQIFEQIDSQINRSGQYRAISRRLVSQALKETRQRPESLFIPANRDQFTAVLGQYGSPVDYLLYARITSGTTDRNKTTQRDYLLTLEMVNVRTGEYVKESAKLRKGYNKSRAGKWWNWGPFDQADG